MGAPENHYSCAHVELGFIRVSMQVFGYALAQAQHALVSIKAHLGGFIETAPSPRLSTWARSAAKTSNAYLLQVAKSAGLRLATFDSRTSDPAALLIR